MKKTEKYDRKSTSDPEMTGIQAKIYNYRHKDQAVMWIDQINRIPRSW